MQAYSSEPDYTTEPKRRFYPVQRVQQNYPIPSAPAPSNVTQSSSSSYLFRQRGASSQKRDDASYFMHRHPALLQRLYAAADTLLSSYQMQDFIYDAYPDYESLRLTRDRLLRENTALTEEFLQSGCPTEWLELLTDTILSDRLCLKRQVHRNPRGDANTTSVQSASGS